MIPTATRQQTRQIIIPPFLGESPEFECPPPFLHQLGFEGVNTQGGSLLNTDQPPLGYDLELLSLYKPFVCSLVFKGTAEVVKAIEAGLLAVMALKRAGQLIWEGSANLTVFKELHTAEEYNVFFMGSFSVIFTNPVIVPNPQELELSAFLVANLIETTKAEKVKGFLNLPEQAFAKPLTRRFLGPGSLNYNLAAST